MSEPTTRERRVASWVAAIRADSKVGRGSCSTVDECWTDAELIEEFEQSQVRTKRGAMKVAREIDGLHRDRERDIQGTIW